MITKGRTLDTRESVATKDIMLKENVSAKYTLGKHKDENV